ncbi:MAG: hypothetical protein ACREJC_03325 [Tepidisphaeraceae bacterium]
MGHVERVNQLKVDLVRLSSMRDWYAIHQEGESVLYYGYYRQIDERLDKKESTRARQDKSKIQVMKDVNGERIFALSMFVPLEAPDPTAPPEWELSRAQGFWSLQIAAYKDSPERKQAAVETVREMRAHGIQAYYHHGETVSSVCIGAWPREAIKQQDSDRAEARNADQSIVVLPGDIPANMKRALVDKQGQPMKIIAPEVEVLDPTLLQAMRQFPEHSVNGYVDQREGKPVPSLIVQIPTPEPSMIRPDSTSSPPPQTLTQKQPPEPGATRLKRVGG